MMRKLTLEQRVARLEQLLLNKSIKNESTKVAFDTSDHKGKQYVFNSLLKLKPGARLLGIGEKRKVILVTKIDDDQYKFEYEYDSPYVFGPDLVLDYIRNAYFDFYELPERIELLRNNSVSYDSDVAIYKNGDEIYSGIEEDDPLEEEAEWRFCFAFGIYWWKDRSSQDMYLKVRTD